MPKGKRDYPRCPKCRSTKTHRTYNGKMKCYKCNYTWLSRKG